MAAQRFKTWASNKWQMVQALVTSAGTADAGKIIATNTSGYVDDTIMNASTTGGATKPSVIPKTKVDGTLDETFFPAGIGRDTQVIPASEALSGGDAVNKWVDSGVTKVRLAEQNGKPADGFVVVPVSSGADATVLTAGANTAVTGLTPGEIYLSATPGKYTSTPPAEGSGMVLQELGFANSATNLDFRRGVPVTMAT